MVVGREAERARIDTLLDAARRGRTGSLVLEGEPGIGKTALLDDACARAVGMRVLRATATEAEHALPFAGIHALLQPLTALLPRLDPPQERALGLAFALVEGDEPDLLAVGAGTMALLAEASSEQPLLVCVDDAHWLDRPSAVALTFAARRLRGEEIAFLLAARTGGPDASGQGLERLTLAPLARDDARQVLQLRADPVPPGTVERLLDVAAGNPLVLLELPVSLAVEGPGGDVPAPERLEIAFTARLADLAPPARLALAVAAAEPDAAAVRRAAAILGLGPDAVAAAEASGLARLDLDGVRFRHPLVRSLAYRAAEPADRRAVHRALAETLVDPGDRDRRAWHLAEAATQPDDDLAALLEATADRAGARGGHADAARALERAARLSRSPRDVPRRLTLAAREAFWAGDADRGLQLAEEALATAPDATTRADALLEIASIRELQGVTYDEDRFLAQLADLALLDADRRTRLLMSTVGWRTQMLDATGAVERAAALERAARAAGPWWGPRGLATAAGAHLAAGDAERHWSMFQELVGDDAVTANVALDLLWAERYVEARHALEATLREGRTSGNCMRVIWNQACIAHLDVRLGGLAEARIAASEAVTLGEAHGASRWVCVANCALATVQAWQGDGDSCSRTAAEAIAAAQEAHSLPDEYAARSALGLLRSGEGRYEEVIDGLAAAEHQWHRSSFMEPSAVPFVPELVEAYVRTDQRAEAGRVLGRFRLAAERASRRWALAAVARCEGLLAEQGAFADPFARALVLLEPSPLSLDRARTQLAYGERLRRAGRRRDARVHLRAAHEAFSAVQATPWVERAAAELQATGATVGPRSVDRRSRLTPQELQIAHLVAEGRTNKEIAAQLYLSPKTIEYHLANAYRKLDVHSRVELARVVAPGPAQERDRG